MPRHAKIVGTVIFLKEDFLMFLQKLRQFMYGRYGGDQLSIAIFVLAVLFQIV